MGPYVLVNALLAGGFGFAALNFFLLWSLTRRENVLLVFAGHCVTCAGLNYCLLAIATADSVAACQAALDGRTVFGLLGAATSVWLVSLVTKFEARPFVLGVSGLAIVLAAINLLGFSLNGTVTALLPVTLSWGEQIVIPAHGPPGWWAAPIYAMLVAVDLFGLLAAIYLWPTDRLGGLLVALANGSSLVAGLIAAWIDLFGIAFPYVGELPYAAWAILMAVLVSREYRRREEERDENAQALRQSEERYRTVVEYQTEFVVKWLPDFTRTFVNESYCRYFGLTEEQCLGTSFLPLVAPEHREAVRRKIASLTPDQPEAIDEHLSLLPSGELRWQEWIDRGLFDAHGKLQEILSTGRDITERIAVGAALRESEDRYRLLTEEGHVVLWEGDPETLCFTYVSESAVSLLGVKREAWYEEGFWVDRLHPDDRDSTLAACQASTKKSQNHRLEYRLRRADGSYLWIEDIVTVIVHESGRVSLRGILIDATERKRLEERLRQSQKLQAIGQLAGGVAHDFNNLLTVINGNAAILLAREPEPSADRGELEEIVSAGEQASSLTQQLLAFSRQSVLEMAVLNLNDVIVRAERMLRRVAGEGVELTLDLDPELGPIRADPTQIQQVLLNLALNARDAMPQGGQLTIATSAVAGSPSAQRGAEMPRAQLTVRDTGCGMTPEVRTRIFEPFFSTKRAGKGTGLGLAVVHGIVEQSGGHIEVDSGPGQGAVFTIDFPVCHVERDALPLGGANTLAATGHETILLVEDEDAVRRFAVNVLKSYGYRVFVVNNAEEALALVRECPEPIDLLVTDVVLPGLNGPQLAAQLRAEGIRLRVLFVSSHATDSALLPNTGENSAAFLAKPYSPLALAEKVRQVLDA